MSVRIRRNVWKLPAGDETLDWYQRAVASLWGLPLADPRSWFFMGSVHGVPPSFPNIPAAAQFWNQCQHQSWYFLPWHRGYITAFEAVVAKEVETLGGPADWALPYWDYSEDLAPNPNARRLPPEFRDPQLADGSRNFLFSRRRLVVNGDFGLTDQIVDLAALGVGRFTNNVPGTPSGFGGPQTGFNPGGGDNGAVESVPHNVIHVEIGGFMRDPRTAAFDPIFWLHHCNIDRLWEQWRLDQAHDDPTTPMWRTVQSFDMHDGDGQPFAFNPEQMLDTRQVLHGYLYDTIPQPALPTAPEDEEAVVAAAKAPELAAASEAPTRLADATTRARLALRTDVRLLDGTEAPGKERRVYLELQAVKGRGAPGNYRVLVDLPGDTEPPAVAGLLSTFGVERASDAEGPHGGSGLNQVFEITELAFRLGLTQGTSDALQVTFQRIGAIDEAVGTPQGLEEVVASMETEASVEVGRINLIFQ